MALADLYIVEDRQLIDGQDQALNVYQYEKGGTGGTAEDLAETFIQEVQIAIEGIQGNNTEHTLLRVYNLGDLTDFFEIAQTGNVGQWELPLPRFNAINFTLRPDTRGVRPGSKRIGTVPSNQVTGNIVTGATYLEALETARIALGTPLSGLGGTATYDPVIIKRVLEPAVPGEHGEYYRFPKAGDPLSVAQIQAVLVDLTVSHQDSRRA